MRNDDVDPEETAEWLEALDAVAASTTARQRAQHLLERAARRARAQRAARRCPSRRTTAVRQHDPAAPRGAPIPGDPELEHRIRSLIRWNAMAMVLQANKESSELGGHIASYQSAATLYEVGFNHFWRAPTDGPRRRPRLHPGPLVARASTRARSSRAG